MKLFYKIFLSIFLNISAINLLAVQNQSHRDIHLKENSHKPVTSSLEKNYNQPTQAYVWESTHLDNPNTGIFKNYNPFFESSSPRNSGYLPASKLQIVPVNSKKYDPLDIFDKKDYQNEDVSYNNIFTKSPQLTFEQQARQDYLDKKQENLNVVARNVSQVGQSLGMRSQGWLLPTEDIISKEAVLQATNTIFGPSPWPIELAQAEIAYGKSPAKEEMQAYKDYYGPAFGPAFLSIAESVPQAFKSMHGFHDAMNYFFQVFQFRAESLVKTGENLYGGIDAWKSYLNDAFNQFVQIFVKRFDHPEVFDTHNIDHKNEENYDNEFEDYDLDSLRL